MAAPIRGLLVDHSKPFGEYGNFLKPLFSKWHLICACAFLGGMSFFIYSRSLPKTYRVVASIQPPYDGKAYLASMVDIKAYLETDAYTQAVATACGLKPKELVFSVFNPRDSNILSISIDIHDIEKGRQALSVLIGLISSRYQNAIDIILAQNEANIQRLKIETAAKERDVALRLKRLAQLDQMEKNVRALFVESKNNADTLTADRKILIKSQPAAESEGFSLLMYSNVVQQNIAYLNEINFRLFSVQEQKDSLSRVGSEDIAVIEKNRVEMKTLESVRQSIENIHMLHEPEVSPDPIKPRKRLYAISGFFLGLMLGIVVAYGLELFDTSN